MWKVVKIKQIYLFLILEIILIFLFSVTYKNFLKKIYPTEYENYITQLSQKYSVDIDIIYAIIKIESNFNEKAVSQAGAVGLMQITADTFDWLKLYTKENNLDEKFLTDPYVNIKYGILFLSILQKKYSADEVILSAYNAGVTSVSRWLKDDKLSENGEKLQYIPYRETRNYVQKVVECRKIYRNLYFNKLGG